MSVDNPGDVGRTVTGYTKLFGSIVHSTIWREPDHVRLVWVTMLALADKDGVVEASVPGLADVARVSLEQAMDALDRFQKPDKYSRNKASEGRRIEEIAGGWRLLNHYHYRQLMSAEERKAKDAERHRISRAAQRSSAPRPQPSANVPKVSHSDSDSEADPNTNPEAEGSGALPAVWKTLKGWEPKEALYTKALLDYQLTREQVDERLKDLRTGPIGGNRGVLDRDEYVENQLGKWKTWGETDRGKAQQAALAPRSGPRASGPPWQPNERHRAFAAKHGISPGALADAATSYVRTGEPTERCTKDADEVFGKRLARLVTK